MNSIATQIAVSAAVFLENYMLCSICSILYEYSGITGQTELRLTSALNTNNLGPVRYFYITLRCTTFGLYVATGAYLNGQHFAAAQFFFLQIGFLRILYRCTDE